MSHEGGGAGSGGGHLNKLQFEKSPYLLQHQHNPVEWYPWGEEAFELASQQNKPIFLSVGYSTCHWCHVMERESFENADVAKVMNQYFINIKVDREERPDVDRVYMTFVQAVSGSGGWPMSVWMTPDMKPFYGGTYYPPDDRMFGRPGFKSLLLTIAEHWEEEKERFVNSAEKILQVLKRTATLPVHDKPMVANEISQKCLQQLSRSFEPAFGGFSDHPKFPQPVNLNFLIQYNKLNPGHGDALKMIEKTLQGMAKGGIYDHIGKGFCRYSTDKKWHVPHFEKMLYDNAQLTVTYALAFQLTKVEEYARVAKEILEYIERDMSHDEGGFYSAEDADSLESFGSKKKAEGAFYVWTKDEIDETLEGKSVNDNVKLADLFNFRFGVRDGGNCDPHQDPHGELKNKNCLYIGHAIDATAKKFNISVQEAEKAVAEASLMLFEKRLQTKPRPGLDTKFIASWNGLMIGAFARAGVIFNIPHYIERAAKAMAFVNKYLLTSTGDIIRTCYREGDTNSCPITNVGNPILGCVDDFANLIAANLELFDATAELKYLRQALQLQQKQDQLFWDEEHGGYFNSRVNSECIVRIKDDDDGAEPSANSTSVLNMIRLHSITENSDIENKITKLFKQFGDRLSKIPMSLQLMAAAFQAHSNGTRFLLLLCNGVDSETVSQVRGRVLPFGSTVAIVDLSKPGINVDEWKSLVPSFAEKLDQFQSGKTSQLLFLKEGNKFTGSFDKSNIETLVNSL